MSPVSQETLVKQFWFRICLQNSTAIQMASSESLVHHRFDGHIHISVVADHIQPRPVTSHDIPVIAPLYCHIP